MASKKQPKFETEAQESEWWAQNQNFIADRFEEAKAADKLAKGSVARFASSRRTSLHQILNTEEKRAKRR